MISALIRFSLRSRGLVLAALALVAVGGAWMLDWFAMDVMPDLSNVQVQVLTSVPVLSAEEIEVAVTRPLELQLAGLPGLMEQRSLTQYGISQIILIFADGSDIYRARQLVTERLAAAHALLPAGLQPRLAPLATGLGEIYSYALRPKGGLPTAPEEARRVLTELRTLQDFLVAPALRSVPGVADVNTTGGYQRQLVIEADPAKLTAAAIDMRDVADAVSRNTAVGGGGLIAQNGEQTVIRSNARAQTIDEISQLGIKLGWGSRPIPVSEVASVVPGAAIRTGAATVNGVESVVGTVLLLNGENSRAVASRVQSKIVDLAGRVPPGIEITPLYDRSQLIDASVRTIWQNLATGALLVVLVLYAFFRSARATLIAALAIPWAFIFAVQGMNWLHLSGNLVTFGAIDFGLVCDGAIVMVENMVRHLAARRRALGRKLLPGEREETLFLAADEVAHALFFGVLIITLVYVPVLGLTGTAAKMFHPMALVAMLTLVGALVYSHVAVPALSALLLPADVGADEDPLGQALRNRCRPWITAAIQRPRLVLGTMAALLIAAIAAFYLSIGAEFVPRLDEGSLVIEVVRKPSIDLDTSTNQERRTEQLLLNEFPEVAGVFARIGQSDIATDPQLPSENDIYISYHPRSTWRNRDGRHPSKDELAAAMMEAIKRDTPDLQLASSQPIEVRTSELLEGQRADVAVKIFGADYETLEKLGDEAQARLKKIPGAEEIFADEVGRTPTLEARVNRKATRQYLVHADEIDHALSAGLTGIEAGRIDEGNLFYPVVVRLPEPLRVNPDVLKTLPIRTGGGTLMLAMGQVADMVQIDRLTTIRREQGERRLAVMANARGRDVGSFARDFQSSLHHMALPPGYRIEVTGSFQDLLIAQSRLEWVVPLALLVILLLIYEALGSWSQVMIVASAIPLALAGGVFALSLARMSLSVSATIGFIALSGIAVLNSLVLVTCFNQLRREGNATHQGVVVEGVLRRLRPVLMTALVASVGFAPMAFGWGTGAELQQPLAVVVIGGIITSTLLTLVVIPTLYSVTQSDERRNKARVTGLGHQGEHTRIQGAGAKPVQAGA